VACGRVLRLESWLSSVAVATDVLAAFSLQVCVAASVVGRLETSGIEVESDEELECASLEVGSGGFGS
jgi:hypothetical protein